MKRSWISKFAGLVLVLTLITTSLVAGTYAKYVTTVTATDSVTVAKWNANLDGKGTSNTTYTTTFDLIGTINDSGVDGNLLAPGTGGSFTLAYDMSGTQVAHEVAMTIAAPGLATNLTFLKFYKDASKTQLISIPTTGAIEFFSTTYGAIGTTGAAVVYWAWPFSADATQDAADTIDGIAATVDQFNVTVNFTATQLDE